MACMTTRGLAGDPHAGASLIDRIIIAAIAIVQAMASIAGLISIPWVFLYGGAGAHPNYFLAYVLFMAYGIMSALRLSSRQFSGRVLALIWHAPVVVFLSPFCDSPAPNVVLWGRGHVFGCYRRCRSFEANRELMVAQIIPPHYIQQ